MSTDYHNPARPSLASIVLEVSEEFGVSVTDLKGPRRTKALTLPRQYAMKRCREEAGRSLTLIGRTFNRDHTTVLHALSNFDNPDWVAGFEDWAAVHRVGARGTA